MPSFTPEEQAAIGGAVNMLRPYGGHLVALAEQTADDAAVVAELEPYIPPRMVEGLADLNAMVVKYGPDALILEGITMSLALPSIHPW